MIVVIIGKDGVEYCPVKKKDLDKHFYISKNELYMVFPDCLRPVDIYHNGAWIGSDSIIAFERNNPYPIECPHLDKYAMDARLAFINEHKLMSPKKKGWGALFNKGGAVDNILKLAPWLLVGGVLLFSWLGGML